MRCGPRQGFRQPLQRPARRQRTRRMLRWYAWMIPIYSPRMHQMITLVPQGICMLSFPAQLCALVGGVSALMLDGAGRSCQARGLPQVEPEVDAELQQQLEAMGFSANKAIRALHFTGSGNVEQAVNWIVEHGEDADIDQPLMVPKVRSAAKGCVVIVPPGNMPTRLSVEAGDSSTDRGRSLLGSTGLPRHCISH